jgi:hypothetical protein
MTPLRAATLPASLFDNEKIKRGKTRLPADILFGMGMTYNGYLVVNTLGGKVVTLDRIHCRSSTATPYPAPTRCS